MKAIEVFRVTTFVHPDHRERLLEGILSVVPLRWGRYDSVLWWSEPGTEQFRPREGANPSKGAVGELSRLPSVMVEFRIPRDRALLERVVREGIVPHHPWEEPVILVDEATAFETKG